MFDSIDCEYPIPDLSPRSIKFQTKSLLNGLAHYTITADGRLVEDVWRDERFVPDREWPFHGDIVMYGSTESKEWLEYVVRFTHGRVEFIRRLEKPASGRENLEREMEVDEHLIQSAAVGPVPGVSGRRLSADEFTTYAPGRLELIDGAIPGGEGLMRLLLTSLGLRQAALIVGRRVWQEVLNVESTADRVKTTKS